MSASLKQDNYYESRITRLEVTNENIAQTLIRLEKKMDEGFSRLDSRIDRLDNRIDRLDNRIDNLDSRSWSQFRWIMGSFIAIFLSTVSSIIVLALKIHT